MGPNQIINAIWQALTTCLRWMPHYGTWNGFFYINSIAVNKHHHLGTVFFHSQWFFSAKLNGCAFNYTHITFHSCCCCYCHMQCMPFRHIHNNSIHQLQMHLMHPHQQWKKTPSHCMIQGWVKYEPFSCSRSMALSQIAHVKHVLNPHLTVYYYMYNDIHLL